MSRRPCPPASTTRTVIRSGGTPIPDASAPLYSSSSDAFTNGTLHWKCTSHIVAALVLAGCWVVLLRLLLVGPCGVLLVGPRVVLLVGPCGVLLVGPCGVLLVAPCVVLLVGPRVVLLVAPCVVLLVGVLLVGPRVVLLVGVLLVGPRVVLLAGPRVVLLPGASCALSTQTPFTSVYLDRQVYVHAVEAAGELASFSATGGQMKHPLPCTENHPAAHSWHVTPSGARWYPPRHSNVHVLLSAVSTYTENAGPASHAVGWMLPLPGHLNLLGHAAQALAPVEGAYAPGAQSLHAEICPLPNLPAAQLVQARA